jgi:hypothetical protein
MVTMPAVLKLSRSVRSRRGRMIWRLWRFGDRVGTRRRHIGFRGNVVGGNGLVQDHLRERAELVFRRGRSSLAWTRLGLGKPGRSVEAVLCESVRVEKLLDRFQRLGQLFRGSFSIVGLCIESL